MGSTDLTGLRIEWELTSACPLACPDCSSRRVPHGTDLDLARGLEVADRFVAERVRLVCLSGGEPLTHPGWEAVARRLSEGGIAVSMLTSGCVWEADTASRLRGAGVGRVWLGVDGAGEAHDRFRGAPGLWTRVCRALDDLQAAGVDVGAFTTVRASTAPGIGALASWIRERGVTDWFIWATVNPGRDGEDFSRAAVERVVGDAVADKTRVWYGDTWRPGTVGRPGTVACGAGETVLGVSADGQVRGCLLQVDAPSAGHVLEAGLEVLATRARLRRRAAGCTACAPLAARGGDLGWQAAALVPLAAMALGAGACRTNEADSLPPPESRTQSAQYRPPAEPEVKGPTDPEPEAKSKASDEETRRRMQRCCYSRALIPNCKCDWNRLKPPPPTP